MIRFTPEWVTVADQPIDSSPIVEGSSFSFAFQANDVARTTVSSSASIVLDFGMLISGITAVYVDDVLVNSQDWTVGTTALTISTAHLDIADGTLVSVAVYRNGFLTFSRLSGDFPPGIDMSSTGLVEGFLGSISDGTETYDFVIRANNGARVSDRTFELRVVGQTLLQTFVGATLPPLQTDPSNTFDFVSLGHLARADPVSTTFDITFPDGSESLLLLPTGLTQTDVLQFIEGMPPGLRINGMSLTGTIAGDAVAGRYLFKVGISGQQQTSGSTVIVEAIVDDRISTFNSSPLVIQWVTKASLGDVTEGYPLHFNVQATCKDGPVSYSLAPGSLSLPAGCAINQETGDLEGIAPHVNDRTTFGFTVRASRSGNFVDRSFSFRVNNVYTTTEILDVRLRLRNVDILPFVNRYRELVDDSALYRPHDGSFGLPTTPYIYLIKGIAARPFDAALRGDGAQAITKNNDYHGPVSLVLGEHDYAVVRNASGGIVYEVVYRILYDLQAKAGGFSFTATEVTEEPVIHRQSQKVVYPLSLRNARMDLVRDCGFPTTNPALAHHIDLGSAECLPEWMTSLQVAGDRTSALGFISAMVVANVLPGQGHTVATLLNADATAGPVGREVVLDRYYLYDLAATSSPTSFDQDETTFDASLFGRPIGFDAELGAGETPVKV